jgi:hypothetical protein
MHSPSEAMQRGNPVRIRNSARYCKAYTKFGHNHMSLDGEWLCTAMHGGTVWEGVAGEPSQKTCPVRCSACSVLGMKNAAEERPLGKKRAPSPDTHLLRTERGKPIVSFFNNMT